MDEISIFGGCPTELNELIELHNKFFIEGSEDSLNNFPEMDITKGPQTDYIFYLLKKTNIESACSFFTSMSSGLCCLQWRSFS